MKVSIGLKVIAVVLLLQSMFIFYLLLFGNVTATVISKGLVTLIFTVIAVAELASSIGLFMSKKAAVYATSVISAFMLLMNIKNLIESQEKDLWAAGLAIIFGFALYLTISCIVKDRKQTA